MSNNKYKYDTFEELYNIISSESKHNIKPLFIGIYEYGFEVPSLIQSNIIYPFFSGRNIIAQSQSGTGKTGSFVIGLLSRIDISNNNTQGIILANTHELAQQIFDVTENLSKHMNIKISLCIGGHDPNAHNTIYEIGKSHILVGTPGKIRYILHNSEHINIEHIKTLVLDESDVLLKADFIIQIEDIINKLQEQIQITIFSATYDENVLNTAKKLISNPFIIEVQREELSLDMIQQYKIKLSNEEQKLMTLADLYSKLSITQSVIFVNTIKRAEYVYNKINKLGYDVGLIHSEMTKIERRRILKEFRTGNIRAIIATDIIARGIDVQTVGIVFNYDIPHEKSVYLHRIGRSSRFGKIGIAINFIVAKQYSSKYKVQFRLCDEDQLNEIGNFYQRNIDYLPSIDQLNQILTGVKDFSI